MGLNRLRTVICLGAVLLLMAGVAMAGSTSVTGGPVKYAREVGIANQYFYIPSKDIVHVMNVVRTAEEDFFLDVTLNDGAKFAATLTSGALSYVPIGSPATGAMTFSIFSGGTVGSSTVRFLCDIDTPMTEQGSVVVNTTGWIIRDVTNKIGTGSTIGVTTSTFDAKDNIAFDQSTADTATLLTGAYYGVNAGILTSTTATIDVTADRKKFVAIGSDTLTSDGGANVPVTTGAARCIMMAILSA